MEIGRRALGGGPLHRADRLATGRRLSERRHRQQHRGRPDDPRRRVRRSRRFPSASRSSDSTSSSYAKIAARAFGAEHHTYLVNATIASNALPAIVRYFDEPFGNSSAIADVFLREAGGATTA